MGNLLHTDRQQEIQGMPPQRAGGLASRPWILIRILGITISVFLTFCGACGTRTPEPTDPRAIWVRQHILPIRSIDPADMDFRDLEPLKSVLGPVRLVLLGEATHGDGATFEAKARLVEFLHREMGFSVLAFESGLYECEKAWSLIQDGVPAEKAAAQAVFGIWGESEQARQVFRYLGAARQTDHPLQLTGFDFQLTGSLSREWLIKDIGAFLRQADGKPEANGASWSLFRDTLELLLRGARRFLQTGEARRQEFYSAWVRLREEIAEAQPESTPAKYWSQVVKSTEALCRFLWNTDLDHPNPGSLNLRDRQMADNLLWLIRGRYPAQKMIVWAATSHIIRNRRALAAIGGGEIGASGMIPMGDYLSKELGKELYALAFTSHDGRVGIRGQLPWDLAEPRAGSVESLSFAAGYEYSFLDIRGLQPDRNGFGSTFIARPLGHTAMRGEWRQVLDGFFFIRTMRPSVQIN